MNWGYRSEFQNSEIGVLERRVKQGCSHPTLRQEVRSKAGFGS